MCYVPNIILIINTKKDLLMNATATAPISTFTSAKRAPKMRVRTSLRTATTNISTEPTVKEVTAALNFVGGKPTIEDVIARLNVFIRIGEFTQKYADIASIICARMLLFDFIITAADKTPPDGVEAAITRVSKYFRLKNTPEKDLEAFHTALRLFSELQNCRCFVDQRVESTILLLDTITPTRLENSVLDRINASIFTTTCYINAYNAVMDVEATNLKMPELTLAKKSPDAIIRACVDCNRILMSNKINTDRLLNPISPEEMKNISMSIESNYWATLLSVLMSATLNISRFFDDGDNEK